MGVRHYKDLIVWQLADQLRREVYRLTRTGQAARDLSFVGQLRNAAAGVASNLAEGFRRFSAPDFARFVTYAFAGVGEVTDRLEDGIARDYWSDEELNAAWRLIRRLNKGLPGLLRYLRTAEAAAQADRLRRTRPGRVRPRADVKEPSEPQEPQEPHEPHEPDLP